MLNQKLSVSDRRLRGCSRPYAHTIQAYDCLELRGFGTGHQPKRKSLAQEFGGQVYPLSRPCSRTRRLMWWST